MNVLITGAKGFIGRHVARFLAAAGHRVIGVGHGAWPQEEAAAHGLTAWLNGEISVSNLRTLSAKMDRPEAVIHLAGGSSVAAAIASPREDFSRTVATTAELLEWVRLETPRTRIIAVSSAAVYGNSHTGALAENLVARPCSPYGHHKLMMEEICYSFHQSFGLNTTIARIFSVYGSGLKKQLLWDLCSQLSHGATSVQLSGSGLEARDWIDVRDVARALSFVLNSTRESPEVINIGTGVATNVKRIGELVLGAWRQPADIKFSGIARPGDPVSLVADQEILRALGFRSEIPIVRGISDYVDWFLHRDEFSH